MRSTPYCKIGDPIPTPRPAVFELVVEEHVPVVADIVPGEYFITSGDAVSKALTLQRDLQTAARAGDREVQEAAARAGRLVEALRAARGDACFLETDRDSDHRLLCVPKNPRSKPDVV